MHARHGNLHYDNLTYYRWLFNQNQLAINYFMRIDTTANHIATNLKQGHAIGSNRGIRCDPKPFYLSGRD